MTLGGQEGGQGGGGRHGVARHRRHGGSPPGQAADGRPLPRRGGRARRRGLQLPAGRRRRHGHGRGLRDVVVGARLRRLRDEARLRHAAADPLARGHRAADGRPRMGGRPRRRGLAAPDPARQLDRLAERGWIANAGTELEFIVFRDTYEEAWRKGYRDLEPANLYNVDYSMLGTARVEPLIRRIRNSMMARRHAGSRTRRASATSASTRSTSTTPTRSRPPTTT